MNFEIVEKEAFKIVGKGIHVSTVNGENLRTIPAFWEESNQNGLVQSLAEHSGPMGLLGVCMHFDSLQEQLTYFIGSEKTLENLPDDWEEKEIPSASWAVFESIGPMPSAIQKVWERIYSEWFPTTGYEHADAPEFEVYPKGNVTDVNYRSEIWIPIIKK